ncbi:MAG: 50S ribosomal protein L5 [SAR324 cluster bacterium]|nr:50S ribosomal protein L5 [SAR324 cluster bacterium]
MIKSHLLETYTTKVAPQLMEKFSFKNTHQVPSIQKVSLNMGLGEAIQNPKSIEEASKQLSLIAGQKAVITRAKNSIAAFKLRENVPIGCMVTLRRSSMWSFLDKLIHIAIPRIRDFRGISPRAFDGFGNYTIGIREQLIFPEIDYDNIDRIRGLNITIVTSTDSDQESRVMLEGLGFPFRQ